MLGRWNCVYYAMPYKAWKFFHSQLHSRRPNRHSSLARSYQLVARNSPRGHCNFPPTRCTVSISSSAQLPCSYYTWYIHPLHFGLQAYIDTSPCLYIRSHVLYFFYLYRLHTRRWTSLKSDLTITDPTFLVVVTWKPKLVRLWYSIFLLIEYVCHKECQFSFGEHLLRIGFRPRELPELPYLFSLSLLDATCWALNLGLVIISNEADIMGRQSPHLNSDCSQLKSLFLVNARRWVVESGHSGRWKNRFEYRGSTRSLRCCNH